MAKENAVIYARFSSSKQQEQSIDGQLRYCREYAERHGMKIVGEYCDRAITGTTDKRPQFQKMIADSAKKNFKYVLVWKLDRFSRDRYASAMYKYKLKKNGVKVISVTESIGEGNESVILEAVLEAMAELYVTQLAENTKRGSREAALQGRNPGGQIPLGYEVVDKRLVINPKEAEIVRRAFKLYADGVLIKDICAEFNEKGYKTHRGKPFDRSSFKRMFGNEKYIGVYRYDDIIIEDGCPPIVDKETFEKCQSRLAMNKRRTIGKPSKTEYLLKGKAFCGHCGASLVGDSGTSKTGERHEYYSCSKRKKEHTCDKKREKKGYLEWYVVEQTVQYVLMPDRLDYIAENVAKMYDDGNTAADLKSAKARKERLEQEYEKLVDSLINATNQKMIDRINERSFELDSLLEEVQEEINDLTATQKSALTADEVKAWLKQFCTGEEMDPDFQKRIIDVLVNCVYVYDDKIVIYFNVKDGSQVSYIEMVEETSDIFNDSECSDIEHFGSPKSRCSATGLFVCKKYPCETFSKAHRDFSYMEL